MGSLIAFLRRAAARPRAYLQLQRDKVRVKRALARDPAPRIVVGSSGICPPGWIQTDIEYLNLLHAADWAHYFSQRGPVAILAEHVWEHLSPAEGAVAAKHCFDYLQPGGWLRLAVPDGNHPDATYREWVRPGGSGPGADDHKVLYTVDSLHQLLTGIGYTVQSLEYFDSAGRFHFNEWDPADGMIHRSRRFDERNRAGQLAYTSLIVDARKPADSTA